MGSVGRIGRLPSAPKALPETLNYVGVVADDDSARHSGVESQRPTVTAGFARSLIILGLSASALAGGRWTAAVVSCCANRAAVSHLSNHLFVARAHDRSFVCTPARANRRLLGLVGIVLARCCRCRLFDYRADGEPTGYGSWFAMALIVLAAWGVQAYVIKLANASMDAASIFFYMMLSGLFLRPVALGDDGFLAAHQLFPRWPAASRRRFRC